MNETNLTVKRIRELEKDLFGIAEDRELDYD
jgi:hypothetical protein